MSHDSPTIAASAVPDGSQAGAAWSRRVVDGVRRLVSRDMLQTVATSFALYGLYALQGVLLARMLGPEGRGQYATAVFFSQTFTFIGLLGTQHAIARWATRRSQDEQRLSATAVRLGISTGVVTMLVVGVLSVAALPSEKRHLAWLCLFCALFLPLEHVRQLWLSLDHGLRRFDRYNASRLVSGVGFPMLLSLMWLTGGASVQWAGVCFVMMPVLGLAYRRFATRGDRRSGEVLDSSRGPTPARLLHRGRPYALAVLASDLFERIDVFLFLSLASFTMQGYYAAAVPAATFLMVLPLAISLFAFNAGAQRGGPPSLRQLVKLGGLILAVQTLAAAVFGLFLEPLMVLVYGERFREATPLALALLPAYAVAGLGRIAESYLQGRDKALVSVYTRCGGAAAMLLFVYLCYDRWAELAIPYGALVGHAVSVGLLVTVIGLEARRIGSPAAPAAEEGSVP
ncbi:MAG: oligosaccharide flippase family protein [Planctomycetota bacterium]